MEKVTIEILSRSAGRILSHLTWLPVDVLKAIERYPYHTARCFAEGMVKVLKNTSFPDYINKSYLFAYPNLCICYFKDILPKRITTLLEELGENAEQLLLNNIDLKRQFNRNDSNVQAIIDKYLNGNCSRDKISRSDDEYRCEKLLDEYSNIIAIAENAGATNLNGLKECWLVVNEWVNAYRKDNPNDKESSISRWINAIGEEATAYPINFYLEDGDELLLDKADGRFERGFPDVIKRNGRYTIVAWFERSRNSVYLTSQQASNLDDIRIPLRMFPISGNFIVAQKDGKWGAIYNGFGQHFLQIIIPFTNTSLDETLEKVQEVLHVKCDFATWDDFHGAIL